MAEHRTKDEKIPADEAALVLDVARVGELERAIAASGTSLATLMGRAGRAVADEVRLRHPKPCSVVVLAGSGNNGGDGWVAAEELARAGYQVTLASMKPAGAIRAEPARSAAEAMIERARREGFSLTVLEEPSPSELDAVLVGAGVVVDALLGTGFPALSCARRWGSGSIARMKRACAAPSSWRPMFRAACPPRRARRQLPACRQTRPSPC